MAPISSPESRTTPKNNTKSLIGPSGSRSELYKIHSPWENLTSLIPSFRSLPPSTKASTSTTAWSEYLPQDPLAVAIFSGVGCTALTLGGIFGYRRYWRRIRNSDYVTSGMLDRKVWVKGRVTSVGDGDNFRLFHTPGPFFSLPFKFRKIPSTTKELKDQTIHIRIAGVDAPEAAHFGNPSQPHSAESLAWLRDTLLGRRMKCQLLRKDQYNRIVAVPYISRFILPDKPLPLMMLREGMAVVYTSGGSEYGPWGLEKMQSVEAEAKRAKKGLWGLNTFEHPADYKKRMKIVEDGMVGAGSSSASTAIPTTGGGVFGMIKRLLGR